MGHFSMEIYAPTGSNLNGNQHLMPKTNLHNGVLVGQALLKNIAACLRKTDIPTTVIYISLGPEAEILHFLSSNTCMGFL